MHEGVGRLVSEDGKEEPGDGDASGEITLGRAERVRSGSSLEEEEGEEDEMDVEGDTPQAIQEDAAQPEGATQDMVDATAQPDLHAGTGQDSGEAGDRAMAEADQGEGGQGPSSSGDAGGEDQPTDGDEEVKDDRKQEAPEQQP